MKKTRLVLTLVLVLVMVASLGACGKEAANKPGAGGKAFKVGYIVADLENPAWNALATGFIDKSKELGMEPTAVSSSGQAATQLKNAQDMIAAEYNAVVVSGTDSSSANATVKALNEADIPVFILHIKPDDPTATFMAMGDAQNTQGNYDAGKYLADTYKTKGMTGTAAEITISLARSNGAARHEGFKKAMDEAGIELKDIKEAITYTRDESYKFTQDLLTANPNLSILWCNYDEAVLGAMKAIEDAGRTGEILLGGFDGSPESLKAVMDGKISVMAVQPLYEHGTLMAQEIYDYLSNGTQPETFSTPCPLVTTENASTEAEKYLSACFGPTAKFPE